MKARILKCILLMVNTHLHLTVITWMVLESKPF